jgi:hypothetical protein
VKHSLLLSGLLVVLVCSCEDAGAPVNPGDLGTFSYVAFDNSGTPIVRGILVLHADNEKISGSWQFADGRSGELAGFIDNDALILDLNPGWVDNNLVLHGRMTGKTYAGKWEQIGFKGIMAQGTFTATRK